jgi:hypothetical protein
MAFNVSVVNDVFAVAMKETARFPATAKMWRKKNAQKPLG